MKSQTSSFSEEPLTSVNYNEKS